MKSSDILKEALKIFNVGNVYTNRLGCCDVINQACSKYVFGKEYLPKVRVLHKYLEKYKPDKVSLFWWPISDRATRIDVLNKCIVDAIEAGD